MAKKVKNVEETSVTEITTTTTVVKPETHNEAEHKECCCGDCKHVDTTKYDRVYVKTSNHLDKQEEKARAKNKQEKLDEIAWLRERLDVEYFELAGRHYGSCQSEEVVAVVESDSVVEENEEKKGLQESLFQQRMESAKKGIVTNSVLGAVFSILFLCGLAVILMASLNPEILSPGSQQTQYIGLFICLGAFVIIIVCSMLALYFFGHLVQCVRDAKDPTRSDSKDEKI